MIRSDNGQLALIDLEFTAWRLPGHDLAVLWILLGDAPGARHQLLQHRINDTIDHRAAFWCSALLVCLREIASHQRAPTHLRNHPRLSRPHRDLTNIHNQIRAHRQHMR